MCAALPWVQAPDVSEHHCATEGRLTRVSLALSAIPGRAQETGLAAASLLRGQRGVGPELRSDSDFPALPEGVCGPQPSLTRLSALRTHLDLLSCN